MKTALRMVSIVLGCGAFMLSPNSFAKKVPTSYIMTCRAGGTMQMGIIPKKKGTNISVRFRHGAPIHPTTGLTNLQRGYCAWPDRGFRRGEPLVMVYEFSGRISTYFRARGPFVANTIVHSNRHQSSEDAAEFFLDAVRRENEYFYVHVYRDKANARFVVTAVQPNNE
jgi:hypothetical protein